MSSRLRRAFPIVLLLFTCLSLACGGDPPDKEILQAETAIAAAQAADASAYAADEFKAAQLALANARQAVTDRDYRLALNHALDSRERAQNATVEAAAALTSIRAGATTTIDHAAAALTAATARVNAAEAMRAPARTVGAIRATLASVDANVQKARAALETKDFVTAKAAANAADEELAAIAGDLDALPPSTSRRP